MAYRDDFYTVANIIGITGPVNELPTVYFKNTATGEYGHITQIHHYDWNVGRTGVVTDGGWTIVNQCTQACGCGKDAAHEYNGRGQCFHVSRNKFVPVNQLSADELAVAEQAIWRCPYKKTDPLNWVLRNALDQIYARRWNEAHSVGARTPQGRGRRGAVDYTASGLANRVYKIVYPNRS